MSEHALCSELDCKSTTIADLATAMCLHKLPSFCVDVTTFQYQYQKNPILIIINNSVFFAACLSFAKGPQLGSSVTKMKL